MLQVLFHSLPGGFKIPISIVSIFVLNFYGCKSTQLYKIQGQEANLIFPYPCDSTEVTLQQSARAPFYRSTDGSSLALPDDQVHRFKVQIRIKIGNCSLDLTISNLMRSDEGTYLSTIYKDGQLRDEYTTRIGLQVDYPPGEASCVASYDKGGDWGSIDCTAQVGSLSGKIECYQDGLWMPLLTDTIETHTSLQQTILIRKSLPVFCCSSTLDEYKLRCECNDTCLYKAEGDSNDPCPSSSETTTMPPLSTLTENNQSDYYSTVTSSVPLHTRNCNSNKCVMIHLILLPIELTLLFSALFFHYKMKTRIRNNKDGKYPPLFCLCFSNRFSNRDKY
ncbi:uncharacterized protein LOC115923575 [Strongylocentrotus purpuratus]|uniref:Uncharacterized protein n=1 Tax=Strongylocentrotus purpuratus TaxID=7668 RepID=A0A7M7NRG5_STRPU|nr:uncharacterized protein LOC115923575 [Strongylocentrotus purpuratus]